MILNTIYFMQSGVQPFFGAWPKQRRLFGDMKSLSLFVRSLWAWLSGAAMLILGRACSFDLPKRTESESYLSMARNRI
jgi:hypothetical protein